MKNTSFPLHPAQQDIYTDQLIDTASAQYNIGGYIILKGPLDKEKFHEAVDFAPTVFDAFKIRFDLHESEAFCYLQEDFEKAEMVDLDFSNRNNPVEEAKSWMQERFNTPFVLEKNNPLFEQCFIKIADDEHWFFGRYHHLMADGYGFVVWIQYMARKYKSLVANDDVVFSYPTYREELLKANDPGQLRDYELDGNYWKEKINTKPHNPLLKKRVHKQAEDRKSITYILNLTADQRRLLEKIQLETKAGLQQLTIAAMLVYLAKTSDESEFIFGIPVHKRNSKKLRSVVGTFTGILPFKGIFNADQKLDEFLKDILASQRNDYRHQNFLIGDLTRHLKINSSESYLSDIIINYEPLNFELDFGENIQATIARLTNEDERNPLKIVWRDYNSDQPLQLHIHFSNEYFELPEIELLAQRIIFILEQFTEKLTEAVGSINILPPGELAILQSFNNTERSFSAEKSIIDQFSSQVAKTPNADAVIFQDQHLSYQELNARSNQLGNYLRTKGVKAETPVAICIERSVEMMVAIWGILKSGGAYVPIDPDYPVERITYMLEDCGAGIVISSKESHVKLPELGLDVIKLDSQWSEIEAHSSADCNSNIQPNHLAYIIYTSGSTGKPKGVMVEHRGVVNLAQSQTEALRLSAGMKTLQFASIGFDASCYEIFNTLLSGGCIVLCTKEDLLSAEKFEEIVTTNNVEVAVLPPSYQQIIVDYLGTIKTIVSAGEPLNEFIGKQIQAKGIRLVNAYGPTENTVCVSLTDDPIKENHTIVIGKPIANVQVHIIGKEDELVPLGVAGEIGVSGAQVARGYLNRPELTQEKFIDNPFDDSASKLYKTGDVGRWLVSGDIEYLGRIDDQVKIRGYRIEPGEIENVLEQSELVKQAVVLAKEDKDGNKHLVAYVVSNGEFDKHAVTTYLEKKLPEYMVPSFIIERESFATTSSGKVDKKALPDPEVSTDNDKEYVAPQNEIEANLAEIWQDLLGLEKIGIYDNFFELGGDSIISIQVLSRARKLGYQFEVGDIFTHQTIAAIAKIISAVSVEEEVVEEEPLTGFAELLPIQKRYFDNASDDISHYNQSVLLEINKAVSEETLRSVIEKIIDQHDALRFKYSKKNGRWQQEYSSKKGELVIEDLQATSAGSIATLVAEKATQYQQSLDIEKGKLTKWVLIKTPASETANRLLIVIHHLVVDGVSWRILFDDIDHLINKINDGKKIKLAKKTGSINDWYAALQTFGQSKRLQLKQGFWQQIAKKGNSLPVDKNYKEVVKAKEIGNRIVTLSADETASLLHDVPRVYHTEINDILLSALAKTICDWTQSSEVVIGLESHGRESIADSVDVSHTIGWFTSLYPLLLEGGKANDIDGLIKTIKEQVRQVPDKGLGFGVLKYINNDPLLQANEPWEIVFNYLGQLDNLLKDSKWLSIAKESHGSAIGAEQVIHEKIAINSFIQQGELVSNWGFSKMHFDEETIIEISEKYLQNLRLIISHCVQTGKSATISTPSDFGFGPEISFEELDAFLDVKANGKSRRDSIETMYNLSGLQRGILFHGLYDRGVSNTYISQFGCDLTKVNFENFSTSWEALVQRHGVLRTAFYYDEFKVPVQCVYRKAELPIAQLDYRSMSKDEQALAIKEYEKADRLAGFDFTAAPLMRIALIRLGEEEYRMLWTWHHILLDGWSLPVILQEFLTLYESISKGEKINVKEENVYENFIHYLDRIDKEPEENYWQSYLANLEESTQLPFSKSSTERTGSDGENGLIVKTVNKLESAKIKDFAQKHHLTVNTVMQGVLAFILHKYTGRNKVVYGVTVAGRPDTLEGVESSVGMYINTLPLFSKIQKDEEIVSWLLRLQEEQTASRKFQHTPLFDIQSKSNIEGDLFDTLLVFENYPVSKVLSEGKWSLQLENIKVHDQSNFPLTIAANDAEEIFLQFSYDRTLIDDAYAHNLRSHFYNVLLQLTGETTATLKDVNLFTPAEVNELLVDFNNTARDYPAEKSIVDLFEAQAASTPEAVAVIFESEELSYKQLNERANQLARYLQTKGVREGSMVPFCVERSVHLIVSVLGILKAGGVFVPIDPEYPQERIDFILEDTKATVVVTTSKSKEKLLWSFEVELIELEEDELIISNHATENLPTRVTPESLAYIIYTSGSTGKPKGVLVPHKGNVNMSLDQVRQFNITSNDRVLQFASIAFDASVSEIFMAFYAGASLVVINKEVIQNAETFASDLEAAGVTVVTLPPVYLRALSLDSLQFLRVLITAGEAADVEVAAYMSKYVDYYNAYGPTECSVCVSIYKVTPEDIRRNQIPIGKPIANTKVFILDESLQLVPVGVKGELYVEGVGVAKGYLGQHELTEEKFIKSPFNAEKRLYKTGDIGRWLPDGNIEFSGRKDDQIKLRGYRVELGEIEKTIEKHKDIEKSVVVVNDAKEDKQLVLYYQPKNKIKLWPSVAEFYVYDDLLYKTMASDQARNAKYRNALRKVVKDKIVLEIGPGFEAILSRICIEEGAKKVYAVELLEDSYLKAKKIVEDLGLEDKIIVIHDDITKVELPEKVDYCVSEIVGAIGGAEGSAKLINASRHLLKDPSCMIPSRSLTKIAAITLPEDEFDCGFEELGAYYTSKIFEQVGHPFDVRVYLNSFPTRNIISNHDVFEDLDYTIENKLEDEHEILLKIERDAIINGFIVWLNLYTDPEELIDTVDGKYTWLPVYFPVFFRGEKVEEGDFIKAKVTRKLSSNNLNPDFYVEGKLVRKSEAEIAFAYESLNSSHTYKGNEFYAKIFENDEIKLVQKTDKDELKDFLKSKLPEYMVPSLLIEVENFPVTISGKIDKKALPNPAAEEALVDQYIAPRSETEKKLVEIWKEVLEVENVGIQDDFFELGGHSLLAIRLISVIREQLQVEVAIATIFDHPTIESLAAELDSQETSQPISSIEVKARPARIPLSFSQERLWFIDKLEGSVQYHSPGVLKLTGKVNINALEFALRTLIHRHEVLRTVFLEENGHPYQFIKEESNWKINVIDGSVYKDNTEAFQKLVHELISAPFDLSKDYMMRANLVKLDEQEYALVVVTHHIASDAWSLPIIIREVAEHYEVYIQDRKTNLTPLNYQYADYAIWQRNNLQEDNLHKKLNYWRSKLEGNTPLQLPSDFKRTAAKTNQGSSAAFQIDKKLADELNKVSHEQGATLYMLLLAAFKVMLYRYSGQNDISVGSSVANRTMQEVEGLVGFFVNTLAFRDEVTGDASFAELLQQVKTTTLEAYENQEVPFEKVVEAVVKERDAMISPLFQVMLVLVNTPVVPELKLAEATLSNESFEQRTVKFDITFFLTETIDGLQGIVEYSTDLYAASTITRMMSHFVNLLGSVVKDPLQKVGELPMLSAEEQEQLLHFNDKQVAYPADKTIVSLFEEQAQKTPAATAVVFEEEELTYEALNAKANQLAHYLRSRGVKEDTLVPVYVERSAALVTAILGILKAGAAYVPIDTDFPADRISYMLADSGSPIVISSKESRSKLETAQPDIEIIEIDGSALQDQAADNPKTDLQPHHLAYVIYTSGSTGKPKGVMIEHRHLVDYVFGLNDELQVDQCQSYALVSSIATDLGNTVIYSSLVFGGALHLFSKESVSNIEYLHHYFKARKIDVLKIVPSHWKALSQDEELLLPKKLLVFGGEALQREVLEDIWQTGTTCKVVNHYGPTETTIGKLLHKTEAARSYNATIPIGKPFSNTRVYVVSKELQLAPIGVPGQLYIAGHGVARGYLNNEELTKEKFITNAFSKEPNEAVMYGTGDLVKYLPDGNIEFIGRVDDQVKIRGYRVELGEIESILQQSELVSQAVVLAKDDKQGNKRLVGYIVPEGYFEREEILSYLKERLPEYMIPAQLVELESLPLTANGKVDRKALPDPEATEQAGDKYVAPRTPTEERLAQVWQDVLEEEQIGVNDDFFELGGHSLLAVRLVSAIRKEFAVEIPISHVFDYPTIALLASALEQPSEAAVLPSIEVANPRPEKIPLSFSQERLWFIDKLEGSVQYHVPAVLSLKGRLRVAALQYAIKTIVTRHEALRTVIKQKEGHPYQLIKDAEQWHLSISDNAVNKNDQNKLQQYVQELIAKPFDLSEDYMIRGDLIILEEQEHLLVVTLHHIASDGWSRSILVKELVALYQAFEEGKTEVNLPELTVQYADFAIWQRSYLQGKVLDEKMQYWKEKLHAVAPLRLPTSFARPAVWSTSGEIITLVIEKNLSKRIKEFGNQQDVTLYMTLLAAFNVLLYRYTGQNDICIGGGIAGRPQQEVEQLIGFFVNMLALRSNVKGDVLFIDFLNQIKQTTIEAYEHQEVPFEKVVDSLGIERDLSRNPLIQVTFMLQNTPIVPKLQLGEVELLLEAFEHNSTKFDLTFSISEVDSKLEITAEYATSLFAAETINGMLKHFSELLSSIVEEPNEKISSLKMLTKDEENHLLVDFNNSKICYPKDKSMIDLFHEQVLKVPGNTAVIFNEHTLTYRQLDEQSNQLAHYLISRGVKMETLVAICLERSSEMIIAILGILKAGGAYVPIDPAYPKERIIYMLNDISATVVVTNSESKEKLPVNPGLEIIELDEDNSVISAQSLANPQVNIRPSNLAYIIYTSGSTGNPKGVMIEHRNVVRLFKTDAPLYDFNEHDVWTLFHSISFDFSVWEIFGALFFGGKLVIVPKEVTKDVTLFSDLILKEQVTVLNQTPSAFYVLQDELTTVASEIPVRYVIFGGEALNPSKLHSWKQHYKGCKLVNMYGITETTVHVTYQELEWEHIKNGTSIIGKPIPTLTCYILDEAGNIVPIGVAGELYIGGAGVARGYLNKPALTAERFVENRFDNENGARLYRTGDVGRWLSNGTIEYLGRIDDQVKIRGYRIELGEVESAMNELEIINNSCVVVKKDNSETNRLVAYYTPNLQEVKIRQQELYKTRVKTWKEVYETEYGLTEEKESVDHEFNIIGWNDSYTGQPIPPEHMREWLDDIISVILSSQPKNVLEIGSGTGLIYYQLAGKIDKYIGADLSRSSINQITNRIKKGLRNYGPTDLKVAPAHQITLDENEEVDTVIINSVVQYFPGQDYITDVIHNSIGYLKGCGQIIIGDVRDNRLLELFKGRLQLSKLQHSVSVKEFQWAVSQDVLKEEELCFSPAYFYSLQTLFPEISHVDIQWKHASYNNELSLYRYTVIISVGDIPKLYEPKWQSWNQVENREDILNQITSSVSVVAVKKVLNPRLKKEWQLTKALQDKTVNSVSDLLSFIGNDDAEAVESEQLLTTALASGYRYKMFVDDDPLMVNLLFELSQSNQLVKQPYSQKDFTDTTHFTNNPLFNDISLLLNKDIRSLLQQRLPDYMVPAELYAIGNLPMTINGKVDKLFLSQREASGVTSQINYQPPVTDIEKMLVGIWQELLGVDRIGISDNFFELGGHSLLAIRLISAIRSQSKVELLAKDIFIYPTVQELSKYIEIQMNVYTLEDNSSEYEVVTL